MIKIIPGIFLLTLFGCSSIDMDKIEKRADGLTYFKNTNKLVEGKVIRKFKEGNIAETANYENGKETGKWYCYDHEGADFIHGYIIPLNKQILENKNINFENSTLSINFEADFKYASFAIPDTSIAPNLAELLSLRNAIFEKYSTSHGFEDVYILYKNNQYRFEGSHYSEPLNYDTVKTNDGIIINFH